jgi:hypothetical protein
MIIPLEKNLDSVLDLELRIEPEDLYSFLKSSQENIKY